MNARDRQQRGRAAIYRAHAPGARRNSKSLSAAGPALERGKIAQALFDGFAVLWIVAFLLVTTASFIAAPIMLFYGEF
jgi:hypothetical protein